MGDRKTRKTQVRLYCHFVNTWLFSQICYGMIYGIGAKALGEQLGVEENDASVFIETFKAKYTGRFEHLLLNTVFN